MLSSIVLFVSLLVGTQGSPGIPHKFHKKIGILRAGGSFNTTRRATYPARFSSSVEFVLPPPNEGVDESVYTCRLPSLTTDEGLDNPVEGLSIDFVDRKIVYVHRYECLRLDKRTSQWRFLQRTRESRRFHTSTVVGTHLLLVGGEDSPHTAELMPMDGGASRFHFLLDPPRSRHCSIHVDDDTIILTGGQDWLRDSARSVTRYIGLGSELPVEDSLIPFMKTGRQNHACGYYEDGDSKILIVAGGWYIRDGYWELLESTELYFHKAHSWQEAASLPTPRTLIGATINNWFMVLDGYSESGLPEEMLSWDSAEDKWYQIEGAVEARVNTGYTTIKASFIKDVCLNDDPTTPSPVVVDGGFGQWSKWSVCSASCNGGTRSRNRACDNPEPANGGKKCVGNYLENDVCNDHVCPVDGDFGEWSEWGICSRTCGTGSRSATRKCDNPAPVSGGKPCQGDYKKSEPCNTQHCPIDGHFGPWTLWTPCTKTCGTGISHRSRLCNSPAPAFGGEPCLGEYQESATCNSQECPVDGGYENWSEWTGCSKTCNTGDRFRSRACNNPEPQHGGKTCFDQHGFGSDKQNEQCNTHTCPVDGGFGQWNHWSSCTKSCGTGSRDRKRACDNPVPQAGGKPCSGNIKEQEDCNQNPCPGAGNWGLWTSWSQCPVTCGTGWHTRNRFCDNPPPKFGGQDCEGKKQEKGACNTNLCPIDGHFGLWSHWGGCSKTCGTGSRSRDRKCDSPAPQHGGKSCFGNFQENEQCNTHACPGNGAWGQWFPWTTCDKTCGTGWQIRQRICDNPPPSFGGTDCEGKKQEKAACNTHLCPVNGQFGTWTDWTQCSKSCGIGEQTRRRYCNDPAPANGGQNCFGNFAETVYCNTHECPVW